MLEGVFVDIFSQLKDPRINRTRKHKFLDIIGLALFAVLGGAQSISTTLHLPHDFLASH
jgi:uncharacterized membrane protein YeiH